MAQGYALTSGNKKFVEPVAPTTTEACVGCHVGPDGSAVYAIGELSAAQEALASREADAMLQSACLAAIASLLADCVAADSVPSAAAQRQ